MTKFALYVPLHAKPGKEAEIADFLRSAVPLVNAEPSTISWFAIQEGPSRFAEPRRQEGDALSILCVEVSYHRDSQGQVNRTAHPGSQS